MRTCIRRRCVRLGTVSRLALLLALSASPLAAQTGGGAPQPAALGELSLEELASLKIDSVYGASRYTQKVTQAPSSISIVTADEIRKHGYTSLAGILRSVRGFYVTYDRNYSFIGVRGFSRPGDYNSRILLLIDGHRMNDNVFGGALLGTEFPLDIDLVERVEIIRGPSSSLYGTSAFLAVINIITRKADDAVWAEAAGSAGSFDSKKGRVTYGHRLPNGVGVLGSVSAYGSDGERALYFKEFDSPATNHGVAERADSDEFRKLFGRITWGRLTVQGLYGSREKAIPTASFGTVFNDPRSRTIEKQGFLDVQYDRNLGAGWELASRAYYDRYGYDGDYVYDLGTEEAPQLVVNKDFARGNWWGAEAKVSRKIGRHRLGFGSDLRDNVRQDQFNYDEEPFVPYLDDRRTSTIWAVYAQDEITIHPKLMLNLGLRHDHYDSFGGTTNPRLGVIYDPWQDTTLKLLYGEAFRAPNAYELFWSQSGVTKSNPSLQPETNETTEVVIERYVGRRVRLAATAFHYTINDLITQETDPADGLLVYNNVDQVKARGVELEAEGRWPAGLQTRISYTAQDSWNEQTGLALTNSPGHLVQFNVQTPLLHDRVVAGLEFQYLSRRRTIGGAFVPGVFVPNLTLVTQKLRRGLELSASVYNLGDHVYADPGSEEHRQDMIQQQGRSFRVKLTYTFRRAK
ncbi:MAG TPA: TonB-dependent receptor [Vicinamibacterales bacterium]|nr:TonB-dependent receptor [Vicinamibacterales bacterium]